MFRIGEVFGVELGLASFYEAPTLAACAAAIDAAARPAVAPSAIGRRDRSAYRVTGLQAGAGTDRGAAHGGGRAESG